MRLANSAGAGANQLPVAIADFSGKHVIAQSLTSVIRADLERSGMFRLVDGGSTLAEEAAPPFSDLKQRGADAVVGDTIAQSGEGRYATRIRLSDVPKQNAIGAHAYTHTSGQLRTTTHRIADFLNAARYCFPPCKANSTLGNSRNG